MPEMRIVVSCNL